MYIHNPHFIHIPVVNKRKIYSIQFSSWMCPYRITIIKQRDIILKNLNDFSSQQQNIFLSFSFFNKLKHKFLFADFGSERHKSMEEKKGTALFEQKATKGDKGR